MQRDQILYIGSFDIREGNAGAQRALSLSRAFIRYGFRVAAVGLGGDVKHGTPVLSTRFCCRDVDCYAVRRPLSLVGWLRRITTIRPFVEVANYYNAGRIFAVVAMDYEILPLIRLKIWCRKNGAVLICDSVEWYEKSRLPFPARVVKDLDTRLRMSWFYPRAQAMVTISRFLYERYKGFGFPIVEVPSVTDLSDPKWSRLPAWEPNAGRVIVYAGNPGRGCSKERLDFLIHAACSLRREGLRCKLKLAGFDREPFEAEFPELSSLPGYADTVEYLGGMGHAQCLALLRTADFSAVIREDRLSTRAGFPTKLAESLGCGTPVIATPSGNVTQYIRDGKNGLITGGFSCEDVQGTLRRALTLTGSSLAAMHKACRDSPVLDIACFEDRIAGFLRSLSARTSR